LRWTEETEKKDGVVLTYLQISVKIKLAGRFSLISR